MRICNVCQESLPLERFHKRSKGGHQHTCKECAKRRAKEDYYANKERYFAQAKQRDKEMRERIRELKSVPCVDCGGMFDPVCMDFDHLPEFDKVANVSQLMRQRMAWSKIEAEIAKREVVCANCHRLRTKDRLEVI